MKSIDIDKELTLLRHAYLEDPHNQALYTALRRAQVLVKGHPLAGSVIHESGGRLKLCAKRIDAMSQSLWISLALLDANVWTDFKRSARVLQELGYTRFFLDLSQIRYAGSMFAGSLVKLHEDLEKKGGGIILFNVPAKIKIVIEMLGLNAFFKIYPSFSHAWQHFEPWEFEEDVTPEEAPIVQSPDLIQSLADLFKSIRDFFDPNKEDKSKD